MSVDDSFISDDSDSLSSSRSDADWDVPREHEKATPIDEDVPALFDGAGRSLADETSLSESSGDLPTSPSSATIGAGESDADDLSEGSGQAPESLAGRPAKVRDLAAEARHLAVELRHVEEEVQSLLGARDPKRKRKLGGTRHWLELEEDILAWRFTSQMDETLCARLHQLVARRHHLFKQLSFLAATRPTWNT